MWSLVIFMHSIETLNQFRWSKSHIEYNENCLKSHKYNNATQNKKKNQNENKNFRSQYFCRINGLWSIDAQGMF